LKRFNVVRQVTLDSHYQTSFSTKNAMEIIDIPETGDPNFESSGSFSIFDLL
jgi:hypothetical protein